MTLGLPGTGLFGKLNSKGLPVAGAGSARKVLDKTLPSNTFIQTELRRSEGKPI